ncbi:protein kinase domain-containing protein, partial [Succinimonas sp.]|uniref:protein kinase domain-containing protein n=1 Tax=Succinimonas sp. TaxID=1936151 RepID=UPI00386D6FC7
VILVHDFFRYETAYYVVTDLEKRSPLSVRAVAALDNERKLVLIKSVLYSFAMLDFKGIVHSDVKPANILAVPTENGFCTGKIIDFDLGFHADSPPPEPGGDLVYLAPEALAAIKGRKTALTPKMDVFALGLIFHEYWTGNRPQLPRGFNYACEAVAAGKTLVLDKTIPEGVRAILAHMLLNDPRERFSAGNALAAFAKIAAGTGKAPVRSPGSHSDKSSDSYSDKPSAKPSEKASGTASESLKRGRVKEDASGAVKPRSPDKSVSRGEVGMVSGRYRDGGAGEPGRAEPGNTDPRKTDPRRSEEPSSPRLKIRMGSHSSPGKPAPSPGSSRKRPGTAFYHPDDFD